MPSILEPTDTTIEEVVDSQEDELLTQMKSTGLYYDKDLSEQNLPPELLAKVPKDLVSQYHLIPVEITDRNQLKLVTDLSDTLKHQGMIAKRVRRTVRIMIAEENNVKQALSKYYDLANYRQIIRKSQTTDENASSLKLKVMNLLDVCIEQKASDLHLIPYSNGIFVKIRINGFVKDISSEWNFLASDAVQVINILKQMDKSSNAAQDKGRVPNSGHFMMVHNDTVVECRLQTNPIGDSTNERQSANVRFLPQMKSIKTLETIYSGIDLKTIKRVLYQGGAGMYLLSGPVGTGKSTSIQAMQEYIRHLYASFGHDLIIFEIQNPIEYVDERNIQVEEHQADDTRLMLDGKLALKSALRSDPDIITYGEIRDSEDAQVATRACQTGLRMFSSVHAGDCIRTINRLMDLDVSRMSLLAEMKIIVCQRLIGLLCPHCSRKHILTPEEKEVLTPEEIKLLTGPNANLRERGDAADRKACRCQDGLLGRVAIPEYVIFDDDIRSEFLKMDDFSTVPRILQKHGFHSMWEKGLHLVARGQAELSDVIQKIGRT